jgi:DNA repair ATPase RecN
MKNMKILKISLPAIVVSAITFFIIWSLGKPPNPQPQPLPPENQFTKRIEKQIDSISKLPNSKFCNEFYKEIEWHIGSYHEQDRFGKTSLENDRWKDTFTKKLDSVYATKFIQQAFFVFRSSSWKDTDLDFIRSEIQTLQKISLELKLLKGDNLVERNLTRIQNIFNKYDEIKKFISSGNNFSPPDLSLSSRYNVLKVKDRMAQAKTYQNSRFTLENESVKLCTRLQGELGGIPQLLFNAHVKYLDRKIDEWSDSYKNYRLQPEYVNELYTPLKKEIEGLYSVTYDVPNLHSEYKRLNAKWDDDNEKANNFLFRD